MTKLIFSLIFGSMLLSQGAFAALGRSPLLLRFKAKEKIVFPKSEAAQFGEAKKLWDETFEAFNFELAHLNSAKLSYQAKSRKQFELSLNLAVDLPNGSTSFFKDNKRIYPLSSPPQVLTHPENCEGISQNLRLLISTGNGSLNEAQDIERWDQESNFNVNLFSIEGKFHCDPENRLISKLFISLRSRGSLTPKPSASLFCFLSPEKQYEVGSFEGFDPLPPLKELF